MKRSQRIVLLIPYDHLPFLSWSDQNSFSAHEASICSIMFVSDTQLAFCLLGVYLEPRYVLGMAAVRPHRLLTKVNRGNLCLHSIVLLPHVFDFLPRRSVNKGLNFVSLSQQFSICVHS